MDTNLLQQIESLLYNGEFAAWLSEAEMPWAAAKELEEFEAMVERLRDNELRVD
jgi:hypothetical protein